MNPKRPPQTFGILSDGPDPRLEYYLVVRRAVPLAQQASHMVLESVGAAEVVFQRLGTLNAVEKLAWPQ